MVRTRVKNVVSHAWFMMPRDNERNSLTVCPGLKILHPEFFLGSQRNFQKKYVAWRNSWSLSS